MLNEKELKVLDLIEEDEAYKNYFFKKLKNVKWFFALKQRGYFNPERFVDQDNNQSQVKYNILSYLEKISLQLIEPGNKLYSTELLEIIKNVSNYKDSEGQHIDNYRTWRYFVKILINIPNEQIPLEIIDLISIWINSKFDTILFSSEIAENFLLKFLPDNPTKDEIKKAERIIEIITEYKWEEKENFWGNVEQVPTTIMKLDDLISALLHKKISKQIGEKCSDRVFFDIADKLKQIFIRTNSAKYIEAKYNDIAYRLTIGLEKEFVFYGSIGLIKEDKPANERFKLQLMGKPDAEIEEIYEFKIKNCPDSISFSEKIGKNINDVNIPDEIKKEFQKKAGELYAEVFNDNSYIWDEKIWHYSGELIDKSKHFFAFVLIEMVYSKVKSDKSRFDSIYQQFTGEKYQFLFFKRLLLFIISEFFEDFRDQFRELILIKIGEQIFDSFYYETELYALLRKNCNKFNEKEKKILKGIIENGPITYPSEDNKEAHLNYWRQNWYSALKENPEFKPLYEKEKKKSGIDIETSYHGHAVAAWVGPTASPIPKEEILVKTNEELAEFFVILKTKRFPGNSSIIGFWEVLRGAAQERPKKFVDNLDPFLNVGYNYVYNILTGILEALRRDKQKIVTEIDWGKLFDFMKRYINRDEFWQDKLEIISSPFKANHEWIVHVISNLIDTGTANVKWAFDEKYLDDGRGIIFLILDRIKIETNVKTIEDPVQYVLNSTIGKITSALIELSLRYAREDERNGINREIKWPADMKMHYEKLLQDGVFDAHVLLGQRIRNFYYLDRLWLEKKIVEFESLEDEQNWSGFMSGYLFGNHVYDKLYQLMKNHYSKSLSYSFKDGSAGNYLSRYIGLAYLYGYEDFSPGNLLGKILIEKKYNKINLIINFFWQQRERIIGPDAEVEHPEKMRSKILEFWKKIVDEFKDKASFTDEEKEVLSALSLLTSFLDEMNEQNFEWLLLSAAQVHQRFNYGFFVEYLDRLKDIGDKKNNAKYLGKLFLKMLETFTPDHDPEHIRSIIEFIFLVKDRETHDTAAKICNEYGRRGSDLLRDLYEKYKDKDI